MRITDITARPVTIRGIAMYRVTALYLEGSDSMWDTMTHPACFRTYGEAAALAAKINAHRSRINFRNWRGSDHICAAFQASDTSPGFYSPVRCYAI